jgi:hypothetical protein
MRRMRKIGTSDAERKEQIDLEQTNKPRWA